MQLAVVLGLSEVLNVHCFLMDIRELVKETIGPLKLSTLKLEVFIIWLDTLRKFMILTLKVFL